MKFGHAASIIGLVLGLAAGPASATINGEVGFLGHYILTDADRAFSNNGWGMDADAVFLYNESEGVSVHTGWSNLTREIKSAEYDRWAATVGYWRYLTEPSNDLFRPYVNTGLGWAVQERERGPMGTSDGFSADLAIGAITNADLFNVIPGLRFRFELRGDYDHVLDEGPASDRGVADFKVALGLHYIFGGGWKKKVETVVAPAAPPAPKAAPPPPAPPAVVEHKLEDVHFPYNKNTLTDKARSTLDADAKEINARMKANPQTRVEVSGHTDWIGSDAYNQALSERRAQAVKDYLIRKGIESSKITTQAYGRSKPIADNRTDEGRALNRRAEIRTLDK